MEGRRAGSGVAVAQLLVESDALQRRRVDRSVRTLGQLPQLRQPVLRIARGGVRRRAEMVEEKREERERGEERSGGEERGAGGHLPPLEHHVISVHLHACEGQRA